MAATSIKRRYATLPFDKTRVERHLKNGSVRVGDFMRTYSTLQQLEVMSRPQGRTSLARGDGDWHNSSEWVVTAVVDAQALITVTVPRINGPTTLLVSCNAADPSSLSAGGGAVFEPSNSASAWARHRHCLDVWDWNSGREIASGAVVHPHSDLAGAWLVETPNGNFVWMVIGGMNHAQPSTGLMPTDSEIRALFVVAPTIIRTL